MTFKQRQLVQAPINTHPFFFFFFFLVGVCWDWGGGGGWIGNKFHLVRIGEMHPYNVSVPQTQISLQNQLNLSPSQTLQLCHNAYLGLYSGLDLS